MAVTQWRLKTTTKMRAKVLTAAELRIRIRIRIRIRARARARARTGGNKTIKRLSKWQALFFFPVSKRQLTEIETEVQTKAKNFSDMPGKLGQARAEKRARGQFSNRN